MIISYKYIKFCKAGEGEILDALHTAQRQQVRNHEYMFLTVKCSFRLQHLFKLILFHIPITKL